MDIQQSMHPNITLLIQLILFLVFVALVRTFLVKPYSRIIEEREAIVQKNTEQALRLRNEAQKYIEEANSILERGRRESNEILQQAKREAEKLRAEILAKVELETQEEIAKAVEEIRNSLQVEKKKLEERIKEVVELLTKKVLEEAA